MHTLAEVRRDIAVNQIGNFGVGSTSSPAQNRGAGDGVVPGSSGSPQGPYTGAPHHVTLPHISCRTPPNNTNNFYTSYNDRNGLVRQLWRQPSGAAPCMQSRPAHSFHEATSGSTLPAYYNGNPDSVNYNRQSANNSMQIDQSRRQFAALDNLSHNGIGPQPANVQNPSYVNYSSSNVLASGNNYPPPGTNSSIIPSYLSITQFNYQNLPSIRSGLPNIGLQSAPPLPPMNYSSIPPPPPLPTVQVSAPMPPTSQPPLVFGPPPRDRRSIINIEEENRSYHPEVLSGPQVPYADNLINPSQSLTSPTVLQNFCNALKLPLIEKDQTNNRISNDLSINMMNQMNICNEPTSNGLYESNFFESSPYLDMENGHFASDPDQSCQPQSRSNIKLKFSKNVVNIPKKIEIKQNGNSESYSSNESAKSDSNSGTIKQNGSALEGNIMKPTETVPSCGGKDPSMVYRSPEETKMYMHELDANDSSFILQEENSLIDMMVEGCIHGEDIAIKYQNIPCFKNIKKLCEKTKNDLMTPHCTARNIHSQGIPWATKDYIFAFTRLTSCWYLLKGYLGQKSDIFEKIEQLYSPGLRKSFELWENTTADLAFHIMKSFVALGNNSSSKWNPRAHSTPLHPDYYKKVSSIPPMLPITFDELSNEEYKKNGEVHILTRNNVELLNGEDSLRGGSFKNKMEMKRSDSEGMFLNKNHIRTTDYQGQVYKMTSTNYDFDSGDEDSSKKYIKPGCYTVPQVRNSSRPNVVSPRNLNRAEVDAIKRKSSNVVISSHRTDPGNYQQKTPSVCITPKNILRNCQIHEAKDVQHVPFKHTPQGMLTSALMKRSREEYLNLDNEEKNGKNENVSSLNQSNMSIKIMSHNPFSAESKTQLGEQSKNMFSSSSVENIPNGEYMLFANNSSCKLNEPHLELNEDGRNDSANAASDAGTSSSSSGYQNDNHQTNGFGSKNDNKIIFGSKRSFSNSVDAKSGSSTTTVRKGIIVTTRRRSEMSSEIQTKRTSIKKCHKSYYNTILTSPKNSVDDSFLDCKLSNKHKYRQNIDWNVSSYNRKPRDGLSRLTVETFEHILNELWNMPSSQYFVFEVDVRDTPDYYQIVKYPMFLSNILQKLKEYKYHSINQVVHDFRRIFRNARLFLESHPDKKLQRLIGHFSNAFEQLLSDSFPRMDFTSITGEPNEFRATYDNFVGDVVAGSITRTSTPPIKSDNSNVSTQEDR